MAEAVWTIMMYIAADDMLANFAVESLKQLKNAASDRVVVAAQFDADGQRDIPRLVFDGTGDKDGLIEHSTRDQIPHDTDMADPRALSDFIDWAYVQCPAQHYCLFLWGHGPELLFDDYPGAGANRKSFLAPSDLGRALADTKLTNDHRKFDIVGIDACCMSTVEVACELPLYAKFLVASQEEVPDFSFPYERLLRLFKEKQIAALCREIPGRYIDAYRDYILTKQTKMASITLSSIRLENVPKVTEPFNRLAEQLLYAVRDETRRQAIIDARASSKGFVAGLYTDLCDFCEQLRSQLCFDNICDSALVSACKEVCDAIRSRGDDGCVIENQAPQDKHCHGVSIYFPYLTDPERSAMGAPLAPLVRGGTDTLTKGGIDVLNKGGIDVLNKGGIDVLSKVRRQRIGETEQYYSDLKLSQHTLWDEFIRHGWSRCLVEDAENKIKKFPNQDMSDVLDERYSAQQCALNLLSLCQKLEEHDKPVGAPERKGDLSLGASQNRMQLMSPDAAIIHDVVTPNGK
jgi:Clostripain family